MPALWSVLAGISLPGRVSFLGRGEVFSRPRCFSSRSERGPRQASASTKAGEVAERTTSLRISDGVILHNALPAACIGASVGGAAAVTPEEATAEEGGEVEDEEDEEEEEKQGSHDSLSIPSFSGAALDPGAFPSVATGAGRDDGASGTVPPPPLPSASPCLRRFLVTQAVDDADERWSSEAVRLRAEISYKRLKSGSSLSSSHCSPAVPPDRAAPAALAGPVACIFVHPRT
ncbi:hypothetical protein Naga_100575g2 [Nannochloropsis gaditana]|uniref:Uncharacterized protein n=1 Tax=Nannochloropsis gaditana TaxID=72520 RepID=W7U7X8_9STRA|nr:hypothetical protein Naga_100575g2 [Nannochloropsis gaditana]